jgi:hypothetical protein
MTYPTNIENIIAHRMSMFSFITEQSEKYYPGADITLVHDASTGTQYAPIKYTIATVVKLDINQIESHIAYMVYGMNSRAVTRLLTQRYPRATHVLLVVCKKQSG